MTLAQHIIAIAFWLCLAAVVYSYGVYALLIFVASRLVGHRPFSATPPGGGAFSPSPGTPGEGRGGGDFDATNGEQARHLHNPHPNPPPEYQGRGYKGPPPEASGRAWPTASLLVAAHNEQGVIERRILNALQGDFPGENLQIVIACDGCSDGTADIVRRFADRGVELFDYPVNRGKATTLNESIPELRGDIVVLSDANTFFQPSAIASLLRRFDDPDVSAVCGRLVLTDPGSGGNADGLYWKYETFLKKCESRLGALLGSNGAIYAIRRSRFVPIPPDTIVDDFVVPLLLRLRYGGAVVYDADAVAHEQTAPNLSGEFRRRARIAAGGFQAIAILRGLLNPANGWVCFTFVSHKILRWFCPLLLIGMIVANALLLNVRLFQWMAGAQAAFYALAAVAAWTPAKSPWLRPLKLAAMFVGMNAALLVGMIRWMRGRQRATWRPTSRAEENTVSRHETAA